MENEYKVLWTGGFDSTYRIVELSRRDVTIQPIYVKDPERKSMQYELKAMDEILNLLSQKEETKAKILPIKQIELKDIPKNEEITKAYEFFKKEVNMGAQHEWLACLALEYKGLEICIERALGEHAPIRNSILQHGKLIDTGDGYIVDKENSSKEVNLVIGNLKLPIFEKTEVQMLEDIKKWGYEDVMSHVWFCHTPRKGKPCGLCNPCNTKFDAQMQFMLPAKAIKRIKRSRKIYKLFGSKGENIYKKISYKLSRLI